MTTARVASAYVEVVTLSDAAARVASTYVEEAVVVPVKARVASTYVEEVIVVPVKARVASSYVEVPVLLNPALGWHVGTVAMAPAPLVVSYSGGGASAPVPTGTLAGDVMVAHAGRGTTPAGWVEIYNFPGLVGNNAQNVVAYRVATDTEPASYTFGGITSEIVTFRGIDTSHPLDTYALNSYWTPEADIYAPSVTPARDSILLLIWDRDSLSYGPPPAPPGTVQVLDGGSSNAEFEMAVPGTSPGRFKVFPGGLATGATYWTHAIAFSGVRTVATVALHPI